MLTAHVDLNKKLDKHLHLGLPRDARGGVLGPADLFGFGAKTPQLQYNSNYTTPSGGQGNTINDYFAGAPPLTSTYGGAGFSGNRPPRNGAPPTSGTNTQQRTVAGDGGGGLSQAEIDAQNREAQVRGDINSGYDAYLGQLDSILNEGLPQQQQAQQGIVGSQYTQGVADLGAQKAEGLTDLGTQRTRTETNQTKTLRDLSANIGNAFQAGNVYLGARGAGDSSAANQYSFALAKEGTRQRSDIQQQGAGIFSEIDGRETKLNNMYNQEVNKLGSDRDQKVLGITAWFAEQQNALKQAKAQGQLSRGQDLASLSRSLLDQAMQQVNFVKQEESQKRSALESWALSNAQNINQVKTNMQQVSQFSPQMPTNQPVAGTPSFDQRGNLSVASGYGSSNEDERNRLF